MEARIIFDLNAPEDKRAFELYGQIDNMASALFEISLNLKKRISYDIDGDAEDILDQIFKDINEVIYDCGVDIEKLA